MRLFMKTTNFIPSITVAVLLGLSAGVHLPASAVSTPTTEQAEPEKGPHNGRMLREGSFALELAIFETGVPPEFRVWLTDNKNPINPDDVELTVTLTRLGNVIDDIKFISQSYFNLIYRWSLLHKPSIRRCPSFSLPPHPPLLTSDDQTGGQFLLCQTACFV